MSEFERDNMSVSKDILHGLKELDDALECDEADEPTIAELQQQCGDDCVSFQRLCRQNVEIARLKATIEQLKQELWAARRTGS